MKLARLGLRNLLLPFTRFITQCDLPFIVPQMTMILFFSTAVWILYSQINCHTRLWFVMLQMSCVML